MNTRDPAHAVERKQTVAGIFHRASSTYDHVGPNFFSHLGRRLVQHANLPRSARVLDVACGRGAVLFPAAEAVGPDGFVTGIDLAEGMVEQTSRQAAERGLANVDVRQMDAEHLEFPDACFDAITCGFAIFFFPQLERALAEFQRTLKPGGQIAFSTWGNEGREQWEWFDRLLEKYLPPLSEDQKAIEAADRPHFDTAEGMQDILTRAGFTDIQVIPETAQFIYATIEEWWDSLWSHGGRAELEQIEDAAGADGLERFRRDCFHHLEKKSDRFETSLHVLYTLAKRP